MLIASQWYDSTESVFEFSYCWSREQFQIKESCRSEERVGQNIREWIFHQRVRTWNWPNKLWVEFDWIEVKHRYEEVSFHELRVRATRWKQLAKNGDEESNDEKIGEHKRYYAPEVSIELWSIGWKESI